MNVWYCELFNTNWEFNWSLCNGIFNWKTHYVWSKFSSTADKHKVWCCPLKSAGNFLFWSKFVSSTKRFATKKEFPTYMSLDRTISHTVCMRFFCFITYSRREIVCYCSVFVVQFFVLLLATCFAVSTYCFPVNFNDWREFSVRVGWSNSIIWIVTTFFSLSLVGLIHQGLAQTIFSLNRSNRILRSSYYCDMYIACYDRKMICFNIQTMAHLTSRSSSIYVHTCSVS